MPSALEPSAPAASQLPDIDTSKSPLGRLLLPISQRLEKRYAHRTITHSFLTTGILTLATYPIALLTEPLYWQALILDFFGGWLLDVFTKSGVAAFYPSKARLVIPGNPRLRLGTRSNAEWFVLFVLVAIAVVTINFNSAGGLLRGFNQALGLPSGAIETVNEDASRDLLTATDSNDLKVSEKADAECPTGWVGSPKSIFRICTVKNSADKDHYDGSSPIRLY